MKLLAASAQGGHSCGVCDSLTMRREIIWRFSPGLNHLVFATGDLEKTIQDLSQKLGVVAALGGQHPRWGTRNALLALGSQMYLEIMGPDRGLARAELKRPFGIDQLQKPYLATWVCRAEDLNKTVEIGRKVGIGLGNVQSGKRTKPDQTVLSWEMTDLLAVREGGKIPYFINWGSSRHPAADAPTGCALRELKAEHPNPEHMRDLLMAFGLDLPLEYGKAFRLKAIIETRQGLVELE